jgi:hypothetical protein
VAKPTRSKVLTHLAVICGVIAVLCWAGYLLGYRSGGAEWAGVGSAIALIPGAFLLLGYVLVHGLRHGIRPPFDRPEDQDGGKNPPSAS